MALSQEQIEAIAREHVDDAAPPSGEAVDRVRVTMARARRDAQAPAA